MTNEDLNVSLYNHFAKLLEAHALLNNEQREYTEKALVLQREEDSRNFSELNQLRKEVITDRGMFLPISVYEVKHQLLEIQLTAIRDNQKILDAQMKTWLKVLVVLMAAFQLGSHFLWK